MAQQTLKKIQYDGKDVVVEVANRDGNGNVITSTYATKSELNTGLAGKQDTLSEGTGITISSNTVSLKTASSTQLGGIKVGDRLTISSGTLSADAQAWGTITGKPFASVSSADFVVSSNILTIDSSKFATKSFVAETYVDLTTYNAFVGTTLPATYQAKITSSNKLAYSLISGTPTKLSDFTNDSGFITKSVNDLTNYYLSSQLYTKTEIDAIIATINSFEYVIVETLPTASASTMNKIYLVPSSHSVSQNAKDEYITIRSGTEGSYTYSWEQIGSTTIDLSAYLHSTANITNNQIVVGDGGTRQVKGSGYTIATSVSSSTSSIPYNKAVNDALATKQATLTTTNLVGSGIGVAISGGVITLSNAITATDVTLDY